MPKFSDARAAGRTFAGHSNGLYYGGMGFALTSRRSWMYFIACVIAIGILSRTVPTGLTLLDKYLGDSLYAVMVYGLIRLVAGPTQSAACAMTIMIGIELFQLTKIPAQMLTSEYYAVQLCARLIGVHFSYLDLLAYASGITCLYLWDSAGVGLLSAKDPGAKQH